MEIYGYEKPIIFGQSKKIYCITHLNATQIEWFRVRAYDELLEKSYNQQLTLTVDTKRERLNGAKFTCRVTDVEGKQYEESVSIRVKGEYIFLQCFSLTNQSYFSWWEEREGENLPLASSRD